MNRQSLSLATFAPGSAPSTCMPLMNLFMSALLPLPVPFLAAADCTADQFAAPPEYGAERVPPPMPPDLWANLTSTGVSKSWGMLPLRFSTTHWASSREEYLINAEVLPGFLNARLKTSLIWPSSRPSGRPVTKRLSEGGPDWLSILP
eukprot:CAMPEP_0115555560 /NCGR_PEP_ID=MMETSP0271-20121206/97888_1 /TAXON_ID=71861 /ORGANISM="Scrippsiella trochoidea, Strain CCMP3099" /LENGTH=147 /DNA_ID=CAMNT_0002989353 /DNA_START=51 /DNA_END=491 /DNA_ORIENTATION=-